MVLKNRFDTKIRRISEYQNIRRISERIIQKKKTGKKENGRRQNDE